MASRLAVAVLAVSISMAEPLIAQLPDQPEHKWQGTHRAQLTPERFGLLEIVSGRLVFTESPPTGLWTWTFPLRDLRTVKTDGEWVAIEPKRARSLTDIGLRFRPAHGPAEHLAAEIQRLAGDASILAAGDRLAGIKSVMDPRTSILVTSLDGMPIWATEAGRLRRIPSGRGFRLVGADLEFAPGLHRLSMAVLGLVADASCTLEFQARPDHLYTLSKGARNVPVLKDAKTGESNPGRCAEETPEDKLLARLTMAPEVVLGSVDGWQPWVQLGVRRLRNPEVGPNGSRWISGELRFPPGQHTLAVGYYKKGGIEFVTTTQSLGHCPVAFTAESGRRYHIRADITGRIKGTSLRSWRTSVSDDLKRKAGECASAETK